ncbi:MAG: hypothetical protein GZ091_14645 [Paludibacter sp.]|nr:hypothetical protein [Paludibacter sp.]
MKKLFSILFAAVILLSGMHLSLATHLCGGEVSDVKLSFTHEKAGCGMCSEDESNPTEISFEAESCCKDEIAVYTVDSNYNPSSLQLNRPVKQLLQVFYIPSSIGIKFFNTISSVNTNVQPPGNYIASAVSLPDICVFLI